MGKYRDHREPRRRRHDDGPVSFPEHTSEPSYFQRPSAVTADAVNAEVMWFNAGKGFGFVKLLDGTEAYLPVRVLEASGTRDVCEGTRLKVTIEERPRGHQVTKVREISSQIAKTPSQVRLAEGVIAGTDARVECEGTVKWYDPQKGFGFIAPNKGEKDAFVHATALTRSGISELLEGQMVLVECGQGKKGLEVLSIRLV
ncbi:cold-shock protein [Mesorhizobium opportunistum]|uniref:Cold-shock DNA-binding domain protein n=1 Tax=Mesorhizobium opportunistum (strain LMG 24607 / HAMBI 3007 / WSM2075) TaxID=536019 RepID=F7YAU1_MESOW|nr:cold-shock protein [Mesorhizobium opportunistum]AEH89917.1 cold-shock DNA-binding domain protein [Mesorhizobium opportunistum WSM2075]